MVCFSDDEPDDGPHHYVMVFGQTDALLVQALSDIGVYVDTILCMKTDAYEGYDADQAEKSQESKPDEKFEEQLTKAQMAVIAREFMKKKRKFGSNLLHMLFSYIVTCYVATYDL